ncbi:alpha beta-hydrolase [Crepidotus variabilis]|uniref:Alpha beta-hydrolase n=1 Tax=Crepidotus variabilis TaxID=179855 RepID=A0A9P6ET36_9AGAR|nr:alpha beta-hydrolase [Crepidotus variabilis]
MLFRLCHRAPHPQNLLLTSLRTQNFSTRHGRNLSHEPVKLAYTAVIPENGNTTEKPLVILHGLFGSKRNWGSFLKAFSRDMPDRPIYALDLRNHGTSPHTTPMTYEAMAKDVHHFVEEKNLQEVQLLGHSMGGKVAMAYALSSPEKLSRLIIADITPSIGQLSDEFLQYISLMKKIEDMPQGAIKTRSDADKILSSHESDMSVRQFLLTNLHIPSASRTASQSSDERVKFIVPLDTLSQFISELGSFPYEYNAATGTVPVRWEGPTLAVKGTKSPFINHKNIPIMRSFFPNVQIEELDTGHWVHAERPTDFRKLVVEFLSRSS